MGIAARRWYVAGYGACAASLPSFTDEFNHDRGELERECTHVTWPSATEHIDRLGHFERVADGTPERSAHWRQLCDGVHAVRFAETKPLPSYLVAFAVGPFDLVDAGKAGKKGTPVRIATPRGQGARAAYAAKATPELLARLEDYTGIPYPWGKFDFAMRSIARKKGSILSAGSKPKTLP